MRNIAMCALCSDVVESKSVHDFRYCKCGNIFVDGGQDYSRRGASIGLDSIIELGMFETDEEINEFREGWLNGKK